ncbi:MAG: hypothetical protein AABZ60_06790, partial [Planctomycetota bacterium]
MNLSDLDQHRQQQHSFNSKMIILDGVSWVAGMTFIHPNVVIPGFLLYFSPNPLWPNLILAMTYICLGLSQIFSVFWIQRCATLKKPLLYCVFFQRFSLFWVAITPFFIQNPDFFYLKIWMGFYTVFYLGCGLCFPIWFSMVGRTLDPQRRGSTLGKQVFFANLMGTLMAIFVIWLLKQPFPFATKYGACFLIGWSLTCLSFLPLASLREIPLPLLAPPLPVFHYFRKLLQTLMNVHFRWFCLAMICWTGSFMVQGLLVKHGLEQSPSVHDLFEQNDGWIGFWTLLILFSQAISGKVIGQLADRFGARYSLGCSFLLYALLSGYAVIPQSRLSYSLVFIFLGWAISCFFVGLATLLEFAEPQSTPFYICVQEMIKVPFLLFFSMLGGFLYHWKPEASSVPIGQYLCFGAATFFSLAAAGILFFKIPSR